MPGTENAPAGEMQTAKGQIRKRIGRIQALRFAARHAYRLSPIVRRFGAFQKAVTAAAKTVHRNRHSPPESRA
jgi:hypothetical protein